MKLLENEWTEVPGPGKYNLRAEITDGDSVTFNTRRGNDTDSVLPLKSNGAAVTLDSDTPEIIIELPAGRKIQRVSGTGKTVLLEALVD